MTPGAIDLKKGSPDSEDGRYSEEVTVMKRPTMKKLMMGAVALCASAMMLTGCQKKREEAAPAVPSNAHVQPLPEPAAPPASAHPASAPSTVTPTAARGSAALPSDQSDDMTNMNNSDAAKPSTLPDSQSGTLEDSH